MNKTRLKLKSVIFKHPLLFKAAQYLYTVTKHKDRLLRKVSYGELNPDTSILVIRPISEDGVQGLMSLLVQALRWMEYAEKKNYIPYVDFKNYTTQYSNNQDNVWEYFFKQPCSLTENEVYNSKNVVISGVSLKEHVDMNLFRGEVFSDRVLLEKCFRIIQNNIAYSEETLALVEQESERLNIESCIGLYLRGTDYVRLKPSGEYVQPNIDDVLKKVDEFCERYAESNVFLVTEDYDYYQKLLGRYGNKIVIVSFDSFVQNYTGKDFLSKSNVLDTNKKKRGMDYLVKIILLTRCRYLISSITMGSIAAYCINGGNYEDEYIFDLGLYP